MRSIFTRPVTLVASTAMAAAGLAGVAGTAHAAAAPAQSFNCGISVLSNQTFVLNVTPEVPASVAQGETINGKFAGTVSVPASTVGAAYGLLGARGLEGTATIQAKFGTQPVELTATMPKTALPSSGVFELPVTGSGTWVASEAGTQTLTIQGFKAPLTLFKEGSAAPQSADATCTADAANKPVASTIVNAPSAPEPEPTVTPTVTPKPSAAPTPTVTPTPTPTSTPTPTAKPTVKPTPKPSATPTPAPTETKEPLPIGAPSPGAAKWTPVTVLVTVALSILRDLVKHVFKKHH